MPNYMGTNRASGNVQAVRSTNSNIDVRPRNRRKTRLRQRVGGAVTTWWWIRHGPTHAAGVVGWSDLPADLSDTAAIARLRAFLPDRGLMVSSDLSRAMSTADILHQGHTRLAPIADLREIHFGAWEGKASAEIDAEYGDHARAFWTAPGDIAPPGGESWNDTRARVDRFVDHVNAAHPGAQIVAVAHMGVILTQLQRARGVAARAVMGQRIRSLSVTRLVHRPDGWRVGEVNHRP